MRHSGKKISWNSYGWVGEFLEIRSGRELNDENNQIKRRRQILSRKCYEYIQTYWKSLSSKYSWDNVCRGWKTFGLVGNFFPCSIFSGIIVNSLWRWLICQQRSNERSTVTYNTVYAQFFKYSFNDKRRFKDILTTGSLRIGNRVLENRKFKEIPSWWEYIFHQYNKRPVAKIYWQYCTIHIWLFPGITKYLVSELVSRKSREEIFSFVCSRVFSGKNSQDT